MKGKNEAYLFRARVGPPSGIYASIHPTNPKHTRVQFINNMNYKTDFDENVNNLYKRFNFILIMSGYKDYIEKKVKVSQDRKKKRLRSQRRQN